MEEGDKWQKEKGQTKTIEITKTRTRKNNKNKAVYVNKKDEGCEWIEQSIMSCSINIWYVLIFVIDYNEKIWIIVIFI